MMHFTGVNSMLHYTRALKAAAGSYCRVLSRFCAVPFTKLTIAPEKDEQQGAFDTLDDMLGDEELLLLYLGPSSCSGIAKPRHTRARARATLACAPAFSAVFKLSGAHERES